MNIYEFNFVKYSYNAVEGEKMNFKKRIYERIYEFLSKIQDKMIMWLLYG